MKVLFLDVDGVLNSSRSTLARVGLTRRTPAMRAAIKQLKAADGDLPFPVQYTLETIDPVAVGLVNRLLRETNTRLVVSSSHRIVFAEGTIAYETPEHLRLLGLYFQALGIEAPIYGLTPRLHRDRGAEVKMWLEKHPEVTDHVILDDGADFDGDQPLLLCDPHLGFTHVDYFIASRALGLEPSPIIF